MGAPTPLSLLPQKVSHMETTLQMFLDAHPSYRRAYMVRSLRWDCLPEILHAAMEDRDAKVRAIAAQNPLVTYPMWLKAHRSRSKVVRAGAMKHPKAKEWSDPLYELRMAAKSASTPK